VINEELKVHVALMVALDVNMDFRAEKLKGWDQLLGVAAYG
jgi:hypothetical protein